MYTQKRKPKVFLYPSLDLNRIASLPIRSLNTGINATRLPHDFREQKGGNDGQILLRLSHLNYIPTRLFRRSFVTKEFQWPQIIRFSNLRQY